MGFLHTCYRITDIDRSVAFYEALGFEERRRMPIRDEAINVFMNLAGDGDEPRLELTYNHGVSSYELGSAYGHIAISAPDLDATLAQLAALGIEPERAAVHGQRRWLADLLREGSGRLSDRDHRANRLAGPFGQLGATGRHHTAGLGSGRTRTVSRTSMTSSAGRSARWACSRTASMLLAW